jgi:hypothetical protein
MKRPDAYLATQTDMAVAGQSSLYPDNRNKALGKQSMENLLSQDRLANNGNNVIRSGQSQIREGRLSPDVRISARRDSNNNIRGQLINQSDYSPRASPL